jgi:hypothetical protein
MSSISYPLNSNTLANPTTALYSGGGGGGVQSIAAGAGISVSGSSVVTVTNSNLAAGANGAIQLSNGSGILKNVVGVSAADNGTLSATAISTGAINCSSVTSTGGVSVPNAQAYRSSATIGQVPAVTGMGGSRKYQVNMPASTNNVDIGISALLNDSVPHLFSVAVTTATSPGTAFAVIGLVQSFPAANSQAPVFTAQTTGNGYAWPSLSGTPGAYVLGLNNGLGAANVADVVITMIY